MMSASKTTNIHFNLKILIPKVTKILRICLRSFVNSHPESCGYSNATSDSFTVEIGNKTNRKCNLVKWISTICYRQLAIQNKIQLLEINIGIKYRFWVPKELALDPKRLQGGNSQNVLGRIHIIFVTSGLKILKLLRLKEVFQTEIFKCWC